MKLFPVTWDTLCVCVCVCVCGCVYVSMYIYMHTNKFCRYTGVYLHTKFYTHSSHGSLVITNKQLKVAVM
jgi:hypothetical protein